MNRSPLVTRRPVAEYSASGVDTKGAQVALRGLLGALRPTLGQRTGIGKPLLPFGLFANVLDLGHDIGLAISIDGVGTKALLAQMMGRYDTIGIDCVAMNVNDILCVGAEPIAMLDYLAVQIPDERSFAEIGAGLAAGAAQAGITVPGGEVAQIGEMLAGLHDGTAFDLVGCAVGIVPTDKILVGRDIAEGDTVIGVRSSGIHSNGLSLARRALFEKGKLEIDTFLSELGRSVGEELLEPTLIYVRPAVNLLNRDLAIKALIHVTSDGFMNLSRIGSEFGFVIDRLPDPQPIFSLIQAHGSVSDEEMYEVFNMGIGFCIVVSPSDAESVIESVHDDGFEAHRIGYAVADERRRVRVEPVGLTGEGSKFAKA